MDPETQRTVLRVALALNFVFSIMSFRTATAHQLVERVLHVVAIPMRHINVGILHVGLSFGQDRQMTKAGFSFPTLLSATGLITYLFLCRSDLLWEVLCSPVPIVAKGVTLWHGIQSWWFAPLYVVLSFLLFILGACFLAFVWLFAICAPVKTVSMVADMLRRLLIRPVFEVLVVSMLVASFILTYFCI